MRIFSDFRLGSLALVGLLLASCAGKAPVVADYEVVPIPLEIKTVQKASFVMKDGTTIYYTVGNALECRVFGIICRKSDGD